MNSIAVIVPVKSGGKSRLSGLLGRAEREEFTRLLLTEVLRAAGRAGLLRSCYVVSPDREMLGLAGRAGAQAVPEPDDMGVNSAVVRGLGAARGRQHALVIPADLPLLKPSELEHILETRSNGVDVGISPSRGFDGTNALLFRPPPPLPLSYDDNSFWNHLSGAAGRGLSVQVCTEPGLMFDVDSPEDLASLARSRSERPPAVFARRVAR